MWPFILSDRLLIVDLVGRYPANYLIRRETISEHIKLWYPKDAPQAHYAVLAAVSSCCPPLRGRFLTRYSPVRHFPLFQLAEASVHRFSFDLHVLGTPPAFVLSQDQTLKKLYPNKLSPAKIFLSSLLAITQINVGAVSLFQAKQLNLTMVLNMFLVV